LKKLEGSPELLSQNNPVNLVAPVSSHVADHSQAAVVDINNSYKPADPVAADNGVNRDNTVSPDHSVDPDSPIISDSSANAVSPIIADNNINFAGPGNFDNPDIWFKPVQHEDPAAEKEQSEEKHPTPVDRIPEVETPPAPQAPPVTQDAVVVEEPASDEPMPRETEPKKIEPAEKVPTLNEILSERRSRDNVSSKISQHEEKDLKSMIKLNDKLMFVRDLFGGYSLAYSEAIELVNRFDTFEAAENFLKQNYSVKNRWSEKQSTVDQFYEILNRRFS